MKVLHITPSYEPAWELGGVVRVMSQVCRGLARLGMDVTVYTTDRGNGRRLQVPVNQMVELGGVKVWYFKTDFFHKFSYSKSLREALQQHAQEFDLMVLSTFWCYPGIPAGIEARKAGVPYIMFLSGSLSDYSMASKYFKKSMYFKLVEERTLRYASALRYEVEMEREGTIPRKLTAPSFVISNGLMAEEFYNLPQRDTARDIWGLDKDARVVLYLGRLVQGKGLELLMKAFSQAVAQCPRSVLILAGPNNGLENKLGIWQTDWESPPRSGLPAMFLRRGEIRSSKRLTYWPWFPMARASGWLQQRLCGRGCRCCSPTELGSAGR